ncbi:hypothetical protein AVEN_134309-1 [Araneus ventricosus]|uniref:Uncharacterized protein n=1 Tax=Araneus ventricosus TaxID=182803 RepID=A0A4Y2RKU8_ARAVE|nr:hypothetical protein AVEN_134309-1 [Araneus ventricosus]
MTRTTPELERPSPNFRATPAGGHLVTMYDLACSKLHTRRIFSGIGSRGRDLTTKPPLPLLKTRSCPNLETELQGTSGNCSDPLSIPDGAEEEKGSFHQQGISTIADKGLLASLGFRP